MRVPWLRIQAASIFLPCIQCAAMGDEDSCRDFLCARLKRRRTMLIFFAVAAEACIVGIDEHAWRNRSCRNRASFRPTKSQIGSPVMRQTWRDSKRTRDALFRLKRPARRVWFA